MAIIDQIISAVQAAPAGPDGTLSLAASSFTGIDVVQAFFTDVLGTQSLAIRQARRTPDTAAITVTGQADFLGYTGLGATLRFVADADGVVTATLTGSLTNGSGLRLPIVTWIEVDDVELTASVAGPDQIVDFGFSAQIVLAGDTPGRLPIAITQTPPNQWRIAMVEQASTAVTVDQLVALIGGYGLGSFLPPDLVSVLDGLALAGLSVSFDTGSGAVSEVLAAVAVTNGWQIAPGIELRPGLTVLFDVTSPGDDLNRTFTATVTGTFDLNGTAIPVFVQADVAGGSTSWLLGLAPGEDVTLPNLSGLFALAGGQEFADSLPSGLRNLPAIDVSSLLVGFTLGPPAELRQVIFAASTASPWPVIENFLTVEDLSFEFQLVGLAGGQRGIGCTLSSVLSFGDLAWLTFTLRKDPADADWMLSGGLAPGHPLNLTDLVAKLLASFVTLPDNAPQIVLDTADVTVVPGRSMSLRASSDTPWQLLESVTLSAWTLTFSYNTGAAHAFTGSLSTTLVLASVPVTISTVLDASGNWTFTGDAEPGAISIDDLLADLASTFGISAVPSPIKTLDLSRVSVTYQTGSGNFAFDLAAGFTVDTTPVQVAVTIRVMPTAQAPASGAVTQGSKGYSALFTGQVTFAGLQFDLVFDMASTGTDVLIADFVHTEATPVELRALVAAASADLAQAIPAGISLDLQEVKFVFLKQTSSVWAFGVRLGASINLNELPIVGSKLPPEDTLAIQNLQILYSSAAMTADQTGLINPLLPAKVVPLPATVAEGIAFDADVQLGAQTKQLHAGVTPPQSAPAVSPTGTRAALSGTGANPPGAVVPASSADPVKWLDVNKQFGIFSFQRVGVGYQDNVLMFALDASVSVGPLAFSMQALTVGSPLTEFAPVFSLQGLSLTFDRPPLSIGGAFLKVRETVSGQTFDSYYGELIVQAATFGLKALGGWAPDASPASFFIYVAVDAPLGGPPFLFITGLAGGFGINSRLTLPAIDQVSAYPLLPGNAPPEQGSPAETIKAVIPALQHTFTPMAGQYWVAAGISFTSFEMIQASAVVSVSFGVELQIGVVGVCAMTLPTGDPYPIAYVEIDVVASFTPSTGLLAVEGKLSPASYLLGGFVKLTGGFAFYAWFSGEHQGDFVVSLGGYHPAFTKPDNYPVVPRLGLAFSLGPLKVVGQSYFALTPSMFMAGLRLTATFEAGPVKAWFDAGVDFLISWAPFHYEAHAWVTIGCSVDLGLFTLSVQIGADLQIWGPAFGGQALVDLDIISFTITFGASRALPPPVGWTTFSTNFLPPPQTTTPAPAATPAAFPAVTGNGTSGGLAPRALAAHVITAAAATAHAATDSAEPNIIKATITTGLLAQPATGPDWILDPDQFRILTASTIPANHAQWTTSNNQTAELPNLTASYQQAGPPPPPATQDPPLSPPPAGTVPAQMLAQLDYGTVTYSAAQVWAPVLNIAPMAQAGVASYQVVTLLKADEDGQYTAYVTGVTAAPQVAPSNTALWGKPGQATDPNADRLIPSTLTGIAISPVPRHPDQVSDVPLLSLIYGQGNTTRYGYQTPAPDTTYTVTSQTSTDGATLTITIAGGHTATLTNQQYQLTALTDPWITSQRTTTLNQLTQLGFTTIPGSQATLTQFTQTPLTDWPTIARIGMETYA
jgi:hypothetical protein